MTHKALAPCRYAWGLALAPFLLPACGSTDVTFELTDAPPETASIEHVYVSLSRVEAHVADSGDDESESADASEKDDAEDSDGGWQTVSAHAGTFDLMALRNDVRATLGQLELPSGKITQIRLFIDPAASNQVVLVGGETCALDLTQVPPTGVKINHPFKALDVSDSSHLRIVLDFDIADSLDQSGACAFTLKPVIKLKRVDKD